MPFCLKAGSAFLLCCVWLILVLPVMAQHEGFIYGEITLVTDEKYTGQIRWGAGQMLWGDILRVKKKENPLLKYLNEDQLKKLSEEETKQNYDWGFMNLWKNKYPSRTQELKCRFGDIALLQVTGEDEATIVFKNGAKLPVESNENEDDLGDDITVFDLKKGKSRINWDKISAVRFLPTPAKLPQVTASPLYGTVQTTAGPFTGFIRWDEDEFLTTNSLDGKAADNTNKGILYGKIKSIEPKDKGVLATLFTGEQVYLFGKSNVNFSNNGIVVQHPAWGRAVVSWRAFKSVTFSEAPPGDGYDGYLKPDLLKGSVQTTTNKYYKSNFVFDLDERWNLESLDGESDQGIDFQLLLRFIRRINVKNHEYSQVVLRDNRTLLLTNGVDVTHKNWGIFLWFPQNKYQYVPWNRVRTITLE